MNKSLFTRRRDGPGPLSRLCRRMAKGMAPVLLLATLCAAPAHAVLNDGVFELDGNAADDNAVAGDDWGTLYNATLAVQRSTGIISDTVPAVFRNGSKDTDDLNTWRYDLGSSPPKDDLVHAYASAYSLGTSGTGDLLIYFGADRKAFSGTASLGFWFFKEQIVRNDSTRTFVNAATNKPATHVEGDTLVAFEYTNGGAVTGVVVYKWTNGGLVLYKQVSLNATNKAGVYCDTNDYICGSTNSTTIGLATGEQVAAGQFFEGGINITQLVGSDFCFASFMATSRSSTTVNASIKNFVVGSFPVCHLSVTKSCEPGEYQVATDTALLKVKGAIINDGGGPLSNITLVDNPPFNAGSLQYFACDASGDPTGSAISLPSTLAAGASVCYRGRYTSNNLTSYDEVTASASTGSTILSGTAHTTCSVDAPATGLSVTKICDLDLVQQSGQLGVKVNFSGSVTNDGAVTLKGVSVCEAHEGAAAGTCNVTVPIGDMAPGATVPYSGSYMPSLALNAAGTSTLTEPKNAVFKDQAKATGTLPAILGSKTVSSSSKEATCTLCAP